MNDLTIAHLQRHIRVAELAIEGYVTRIAELESDLRVCKELAVVALENLTQLTKRNQELVERVTDLRRQLRELVQVAA
jgi:hypothetical protein